MTLLTNTCPGLVAQIEAGRLDGPETRAILEKALAPMLARGIDTVVLGCTHYPFVIPLIEEIAGPGVRVIDPAPAVARQGLAAFDIRGDPAEAPPASCPAPARYLTTGDPSTCKPSSPPCRRNRRCRRPALDLRRP